MQLFLKDFLKLENVWAFNFHMGIVIVIYFSSTTKSNHFKVHHHRRRCCCERYDCFKVDQAPILVSSNRPQIFTKHATFFLLIQVAFHIKFSCSLQRFSFDQNLKFQPNLSVLYCFENG